MKRRRPSTRRMTTGESPSPAADDLKRRKATREAWEGKGRDTVDEEEMAVMTTPSEEPDRES